MRSSGPQDAEGGSCAAAPGMSEWGANFVSQRTGESGLISPNSSDLVRAARRAFRSLHICFGCAPQAHDFKRSLGSAKLFCPRNANLIMKTLFWVCT